MHGSKWLFVEDSEAIITFEELNGLQQLLGAVLLANQKLKTVKKLLIELLLIPM